jgi:hypothetical protein
MAEEVENSYASSQAILIEDFGNAACVSEIRYTVADAQAGG